MNIKIKVDAARVLAKINGSKFKTPLAVRAAVAKAGMEVARRAKDYCPVDTGNLRNSIIFKMSGPYEADVTAYAYYAMFVEWGTSKMFPRTFMTPAMREVQPQFEAEMTRIARSIF